MVSAYRLEDSPFSDLSFTSVEPARGVVDRGEAEFKMVMTGGTLQLFSVSGKVIF